MQGSRKHLSQREWKPVLCLVALFLAVALAVPAMAKPVSKNLSLSTQAKFSGTLLDAGDYKLLIEDATVTVKKGGETIAQIQGQWEPTDRKHRNTSILRGANGQVTEIRFEGERRTFVIRQ